MPADSDIFYPFFDPELTDHSADKPFNRCFYCERPVSPAKAALGGRHRFCPAGGALPTGEPRSLCADAFDAGVILDLRDPVKLAAAALAREATNLANAAKARAKAKAAEKAARDAEKAKAARIKAKRALLGEAA